MAEFGVKVKLQLDNAAAQGDKLRKDIQRALNQSVKANPLTIKGVKVDLPQNIGGSIRRGVESQLASKPIVLRHFQAAISDKNSDAIIRSLNQSIKGKDLTIKVSSINADAAVKNLKKQLTTMLGGISVGGLKTFLGTDGINEAFVKSAEEAEKKLIEAQEQMRKRMVGKSGANVVLNELSSQIKKAFRDMGSSATDEESRRLTDAFSDITTQIEAARTLEGQARDDMVRGIAERVAAYRKEAEAIAGRNAAAKEAARTASADKAARDADAVGQAKLSQLESGAERVQAAIDRIADSDVKTGLQSDLDAVNESLKTTADMSERARDKMLALAAAELKRIESSANRVNGGTPYEQLGRAESELDVLEREAGKIDDRYHRQRQIEEINEQRQKINELKRATESQQSSEIDGINDAVSARRSEISGIIDQEKAIRASKKAGEDAAKTNERASAMISRISNWKIANPRGAQMFSAQLSSSLKELENGVSTKRLSEITAEFKRMDAQMRQAGASGKNFSDVLVDGWKRFGGWSIVTKSFMMVVNTLKQMGAAVYDVDTAMTELRKVTNLTAAEYDKFENSAGEMATRVGATLADTINATADFSRLGYEIGDASMLAEAALTYKNIGDGITDIGTATESLISTMQAFGAGAEDAMFIVDKFNETGKETCPSAWQHAA